MSSTVKDKTDNWFTTFEWNLNSSVPICSIRTRKGTTESIERLTSGSETTDQGTVLVFGIGHEFEEESKGLASLLRRLLHQHGLTKSTFRGTEGFFNDLDDILLLIGNGHWPRKVWARLEEVVSLEEVEILYHPKEYPITLFSPPMQLEGEISGGLLMKAMIAAAGNKRRNLL